MISADFWKSNFLALLLTFFGTPFFEESPFLLWGDPVQIIPQNPPPPSSFSSTTKSSSDVLAILGQRRLPEVVVVGGHGEKEERMRIKSGFVVVPSVSSLGSWGIPKTAPWHFSAALSLWNCLRETNDHWHLECDFQLI